MSTSGPSDQGSDPSADTRAADPSAEGYHFRYKDELPRAPMYDGARDPSILNAWIEAMEMRLDALKVPEKEMIRFAAFHLTGAAMSWFSAIRDTITDTHTWFHFLVMLRNTFMPPNYINMLATKMEQLKQTTSVLEYALEFEEIRRQLPKNYMSEGQAVYKFTHGLKPLIQRSLALKWPETLTEAIQSADRVDQSIIEGQNFLRFVTNRNVPRSQRTERNMQHMFTPQLDAEGDVIMANTLQKLSPADREKLRKAGICFRCRKGKHYARDCPGNPSSTNRPRRQ